MVSQKNDLNNKSGIWHLIDAIQRVVGGGVAKKVTVVAYFNAAGECIGREEIQVCRLYPREIFEKLAGGD